MYSESRRDVAHCAHAQLVAEPEQHVQARRVHCDRTDLVREVLDALQCITRPGIRLGTLVPNTYPRRVAGMPAALVLRVSVGPQAYAND